MFDYAVIGAGILGAATAYRLALAGARVVVLEAGEPAGGTTSNSFAWLNAVHKEPEAYHRLNAAGIAEYRLLADELATDFGLHWSGALEWSATATEQAAQAARVTRLAERGYTAAWLSRERVAELEPSLVIDEQVAGVAHYADDGWVDAPRLVRLLLSRALAEGAELWRGAHAGLTAVGGSRVRVSTTEHGEVAAGNVIICGGIAAQALLAAAGFDLPMRRQPGLLAVTTPSAQRPRQVLYAPGFHMREDASGGLLLGADDTDALTTEDTPPGAPPDYAQVLLERATAIWPPAQEARLASVRIGVRPVPADGQTVVGHVPGTANAWVAVTHSGITLGPLLGRLLTEEIGGGPSDPRLASFRPDRFLDAQ